MIRTRTLLIGAAGCAIGAAIYATRPEPEWHDAEEVGFVTNMARWGLVRCAGYTYEETGDYNEAEKYMLRKYPAEFKRGMERVYAARCARPARKRWARGASTSERG